MKTIFASTLIGFGLLGCQANKPAPIDDLSAAAAKADAFATSMQIVGALGYGITSTPVDYTARPRYRAFTFDGTTGDTVAIWVRSPNGDAVAWVLDDQFHKLAMNDDADDSTTDSHITLTLPAGASTHYIVFRDYYLQRAQFTVQLAGTRAAPAACADDGGLCNAGGDCCSGSCSGDRVCIHAPVSCSFGYGSDACSFDSECCSGHCEHSPSGSYCQAGLLPDFYRCDRDEQCQSHICDYYGYCATWRESGRVPAIGGTTSGSPTTCAGVGEACGTVDCCFDYACYLGQCIHTQGTRGAPCARPSDCQAGQACLFSIGPAGSPVGYCYAQ